MSTQNINNKAMNTEQAQKSYVWKIEKATQQERSNKKNWPFRVVQYSGSRKVSTSLNLSNLKDSFTNTMYNSNSCPVVDTRYDLFVKEFQDKTGVIDLFISENDIYYTLEATKDKLYRLKDIPSFENIKDALMQKEVIGGSIEENLKQCTKAYVNAQSMEEQQHYETLLSDYIRLYIDTRKRMRVFRVDNKSIFDALCGSQCSNAFKKLKNIVFIRQNGVLVDIQNKKSFLSKDRLSVMFESVNMEDNQGILSNATNYRTALAANYICKNYFNAIDDKRIQEMLLPNILSKAPRLLRVSIEELPPQTKLGFEFYNTMVEKYKGIDDLKTEVFRNMDRKYTQEEKKELDDIREKKYLDFQLLQESLVYLENMRSVIDVINKIADIQMMNNVIIEHANNIEKSLWINHMYVKSTRKLVNDEFDYKRENIRYKIDPINIEVFLGIAQDRGLKSGISVERYRLFESIVPEFLLHKGMTAKSMNVGFSSVETAKNSVKISKELKKHMYDLLEVYIGVQFGILGLFMTRFGNTTPLIRPIITLFRGKEETTLYHSKNILDVAERCLYNIKGFSLLSTNGKFYGSETSKAELGDVLGACKRYVNCYNSDNDSYCLVHTAEAGSESKRIENLNVVYKSYLEIYTLYNRYFGVKE